jgi:hypothetical protein
VVLVAQGFDPRGKKHALKIPEGRTEKTRVVRALLSDLIARGLNADVEEAYAALERVKKPLHNRAPGLSSSRERSPARHRDGICASA